ncbi:MAG: putative Zn-dependent protease with MMP-like domain [Phycisphaerales bacterium]
MTPDQRALFDRLVDQVVQSLPPQAIDAIERVPVILDDRATPQMLREFGIDPSASDAHLEVCGLHTGVMDTEMDSESLPTVPSQIHLFREAIADLAGGWGSPGFENTLLHEIRITLLHEIGHQLGLGEDDLEDLGYD